MGPRSPGVALAILTSAALAACDPTWGGGTGVGNPGSTQLTTAAARHASFDQGSGKVDAIELESCAGRLKVVDVGEAVSLLHSGALDVTAGKWCKISALFEPPLTWSGSTDSGGTFDLELDVSSVRIPLANALVVDGNTLVAELGYAGWLTNGDLGFPVAGQHVTVQPGDALHDVLAARISRGSALFDDDDGDGEVDDDERNEHELGEGSERGDDDASDTDDL